MRLLPESPVEFLEPLSRPPEPLYVTEFECPFGTLVLAGTEGALVFVTAAGTLDDFSRRIMEDWGVRTVHDTAPLERHAEGFTGYFRGDGKPFRGTVQPLKVSGFTLDVHRFLARIPFGTAMTYGEVADALGRPGAARAVGNACGRNRTLIVVPCHRVVASSGLGGFGAGLPLKERLLEFEGTSWKRRGTDGGNG